MQPRPLSEIARACGGQVYAPGADGTPTVVEDPTALDELVAAVGPDVVIDSRRATDGSLFVAFAGERVDGHDFVDAAVAGGAVAALTERAVEGAPCCIVVDDVQTGLARLARHVIDTSPDLRVVGVTGSSGKTSTKDLIAQVLDRAGPTVAPVGSFNNEIGAPLTATRCDADTRFLVSEMGARGIGHVAHLTRITPPDVGVVLNVGHAHVGEFGSQDAIARAKGELIEALPAHGWAVLNGDDPRVSAMVSRKGAQEASRTGAPVARFSVGAAPADGGQVQVWATQVRPDDLDRYTFTMHVARQGQEETTHPVSLRQTGAHHVPNALAAATVGVVLGLDTGDIAAALCEATARSAWRMEITELPGGAVILNDAYNANPDSMASALETLGRIGRARRRTDAGARTFALLGDMLELGEGAEEAHRELGALAHAHGVSDLIAIGGFAEDICAGAREAADAHTSPGGGRDIATAVVADKFAMAAAVPPLGASDVVLIKASRGLGLETVAEDLARAGSGGLRVDGTGDER